jgi:hypothetical protein
LEQAQPFAPSSAQIKKRTISHRQHTTAIYTGVT